MERGFVVSLVLCLLVASSYQYGILRVEEIWATDDASHVQIEEMRVSDSHIYIDYIESLSGEGVSVEDVIFNDGSITIPGDFLTCCGVEFKSLLTANGDIFADAGDSSTFSFTVDSGSGDVFIQDDLRAQGGINVADRFFVDGVSGDTVIDGAVTNTNGGTFVRDKIDKSSNKLALGVEGEIETLGNTQVTDDVYYGPADVSADKTIGRYETSSTSGGATYLVGQAAPQLGGNLNLIPGSGATNGNIWLATSKTSNLFFGRTALSNNEAGGTTEFLGQYSTNGNGGDLFFDGGDSSSSFGTGGDVVITPGLSSSDGRPGRLVLGSPQSEEVGHDLVFGRPPVSSGTARATILEGQSSATDAGGSIYLRAGTVETGTGSPGDLILTPGVSSTGESTVFFGNPIAKGLQLTRVPTVTSGGWTKLVGQEGENGLGGNLVVDAGSSQTGLGGELHLTTGSSGALGHVGEIVLGDESSELVFTSPAATTPVSIRLRGQDGGAGTGGDVELNAGNGVVQGGDIVLVGGTGAASIGGGVSLSGGAGPDQGGEIVIRAGDGYQRNGGDVTVAAENANILLSAEVDLNNEGRIVAGPAANRFYVDEVAVLVEDATVVIRGGNDWVTIASDPNALVSWNGTPILKASLPLAPQTLTIPTSLLTIRSDVSALAVDYENILQGLNQCGHNLVTSVLQPGGVAVCP